MTDQSNLDLIWALGGGSVDPGDSKYTLGWVTEIPTFENFNFVLQTTTQNLLALAEHGGFTWQAEIGYKAGTTAIEGTKMYTCILDHTNELPSADTNNNYWVLGFSVGGNVGELLNEDGLLIENVNSRGTTVWTGNDLTIKNSSGIISLATDDGTDNWLFANVSGTLVFADVDNVSTPDGRNIAPGQSGVYEIFHQGNPPTISDVGGGVEEAPNNGIIYGRKNNSWVQVSSTTISLTPPSNDGDGSGWYNLEDGQLYLDIDDGDSSQWVLANPPVLPSGNSLVVQYHATTSAARIASQNDGGTGLHVAPEVAPALIF